VLQNMIDPNAKISDAELELFAQKIGLHLPRAYVDFLLHTNGGQPVPSAFSIIGFPDNPDGVVQAFFGLNATIGTEDLEKNIAELDRRIPNGVFPIASTEGDDFLILDLRKHGAPVLFWDRRPFWGSSVWNEADLYLVAHDFESFLNALHNR